MCRRSWRSRERGWIGLVGVGAKGMVLVFREEGELKSLRGGKVGILAKSTVFGEDLCQSEGGAEWLLGRHGQGSGSRTLNHVTCSVHLTRLLT